ncbi:hypothetical protein KP509_29G034300 [Ceratopteris richardii]|uniref:Uncharacterized protein n=1 Tax=Ceratopteris richardii TaxID=49495 RepID=A0A8T2R8A4_CERRI|nr:hypothetical protein KP509_29G034300 [Ceratopteris richardii]
MERRPDSYLNRKRYGNQLDLDALDYWASVLEYLGVEVLKLSGNAVQDSKRSRIITGQIKLVIR